MNGQYKLMFHTEWDTLCNAERERILTHLTVAVFVLCVCLFWCLYMMVTAMMKKPTLALGKREEGRDGGRGEEGRRERKEEGRGRIEGGRGGRERP